jgi:hypothetical protein
MFEGFFNKLTTMKYKHLEAELDKIFGPFAQERTLILNAIKKDEELNSQVSSSNDASKIINIFNEIFEKKSRVMTKKVLNRYKEILKHFTLQDIKSAMESAKDDDFHTENSYKYCTLEYFSRMEQIDKWLNVTKEEKKSDFVMPTFNVRG